MGGADEATTGTADASDAASGGGVVSGRDGLGGLAGLGRNRFHDMPRSVRPRDSRRRRRRIRLLRCERSLVRTSPLMPRNRGCDRPEDRPVKWPPSRNHGTVNGTIGEKSLFSRRWASAWSAGDRSVPRAISNPATHRAKSGIAITLPMALRGKFEIAISNLAAHRAKPEIAIPPPIPPRARFEIAIGPPVTH